MLPLLGAVGGALARGAASGAARGAVGKSIAQTAKNEVKEKAITISKEKLLNKKSPEEGGGGALVKQSFGGLVKASSSAIVKTTPQTLESPKEKSSDLLSELLSIKSILESIKKVIDSQSAFDKNEYDARRKSLELSKRKQNESKLEEKKSDTGGKAPSVSTPGIPFFERIKRFLLFTFLGSLANFALTHLPKIIDIITSIAKGIDSTWEVIKFAIISISTNFPKQIRFLARLTRKLFGGPVRLIGKLITKTGVFAFNILKKAGSALLNLVKGPIETITKKILGNTAKQAGKEAVKQTGKEVAKKSVASGSGKLLTRLRAFSKVFKRVPVVGALIGIGIDLAMGESLDRAVVGAIGATIGSAIGGAIGTGVIPIPIVGTAVGGVVGGAIGDWLAKKLYGDLTGRVAAAEKETEKQVSKKAAGGGFFGFLKQGVKSVGSAVGSAFTRQTTVAKRYFKSDSGGSKFFSRGSQIKVPKEEEIEVFDEGSRKYLLGIMNVFNTGSFVGDLLKLGSYMTLGKVVKSSEASSVADTMVNEFYNSPFLASINDENEKKFITTFTDTLRKWARNNFENNISNFQSTITPLVIERRNQLKTTGNGSGGGGGDGSGGGGGEPEDPGPSGPTSTLIPSGGLKGLTDADWKELAYIVSGEAGPGNDRYGVAAAVLNRVASPAWPNTIRAVGRQEGQFEAVYTGKAKYDQKLADDLKKNQGKIADALQKLNGRDAFKGRSMYAYMGSGDVKFDARGNFYHYRQQNGKNDPAPKNPDQSWKKWVSSTTPTKPKPSGGHGDSKPSSIKPTASKASNLTPMQQWANANPKLAAVKAERDRTRGTSATTNPLMVGLKENLPAPKILSPSITPVAFSKATPDLSSKVVQLRTQATYEVNSSPIVLMQMPQPQSPPLGGTKARPNDGKTGSYLDAVGIDIEKAVYMFSLY
jgi:hypothetical protein